MQSADRALAILATFDEDRLRVRVSELAGQLDMHKSSVSRLLATLESRGLVRRDGEHFSPGPELARLGGLAVRALTLADVARAPLADLAAEAGEAVNLAVRQGDGALNVHQVDSDHFISVDWRGRIMPLHATANGKALLAWGGDLPTELAALAPRTLTDLDALREELERVRVRGYATAVEELEAGLHAVAAPVFDAGGHCIAAVSVAGPAFRLPEARLAELGEHCIAASEQISAALGSRPRAPHPPSETTEQEVHAMTVNENPGILQYSRLRKSPYFYASRRHGVQLYSVYNHTYHPRHYGDPVAEYYHLLEGVTLWDVGVEKQIEISGPDAFDFTQMLVARDLNKCAVEQCKYVFLCTKEGGILNDPVLLRVEEDRFWLSLADSDVELWAKGVAVNSGMNVQIKELDVGPLQVQGPKSKDVMVDLFGDSILEIPYYYMRAYELDGMRVLVSRTGYTSELGFEIYLYDAYENGIKLWDKVLEAGKPHGLAVIGPCHIRRIEGGILALPVDMYVDTNPYEVGMGYDWMVDLEQATDFIGKEALTKIKAEGPKRQLIGVEISGPGLGSYNDGSMIDVFPVHHGGKRIGEVTSACYSPRMEKNIGFAMVPTELSELGTEYEVEVPTGRESAVVVPKPFVDAAKETPKQELSAAGAGQASSAS